MSLKSKTTKVLWLVLVIAAVFLVRYVHSEWQLNRFAKHTVIPTFSEAATGYGHVYRDHETWAAIGGAVFDGEGDGAPEVFVSGAAGQPDAVLAFRDGNIVNIVEELGISDTESAAYGAHSFDVDGDRDDDLVVIREEQLVLYTNSDGIFKERLIPLDIEEKATVVTVESGDLDGDSLPDLYISTFMKKPLFKPATFNDPEHLTANYVLKNNGNYTFTDVTNESGLGYAQNTFFSRFVDFDGDGLLDVLVIPNTDRVRLYRNLGSLRFEQQDPLTDYGFWMGVAVEDFDNDGDDDIFLSNAGGSIPQFMLTGDALDSQPIDVGWRMLRNDGEFKFVDITDETGVGADEWAWGAEAADFNNDGRKDLVVLENFIEWPVHRYLANPGRLLIQGEDGRFRATESRSGVSNPIFGQTPIVVDMNGDGFLDLFYLNLDGPTRFFLNNTHK